jgi:cysteine desulfurase
VAAAAALERDGWQVRRWPVDRLGHLDLSRLEELLAPPTRLVSLIWGQSEVGTLQPLPAVAEACRRRGVVLHTDAVQCAGHLRIRWSDLPADLLTLSAHKFQGPRGCGVLLHRLDRPLHPLLGGGGQEFGLRAGTPAVALCHGTALALRRAVERLEAAHGRDPLAGPRDRLLGELLQLPGVRLLGHPVHRLPHHIALSLSDPQDRPLPGRSVVHALARRGVAVSSGTACRSGRSSPSPVLTAMGLSPERAASGLRLTLGPWLERSQLARVPAALREAMTEAAAWRERGPAD